MEIERELNPGFCVVVSGCLLLPVQTAVWWFAGCEWALAVWIDTLLVAGLADRLVAAWRLPPRAWAASKLTLAEFKRLHPADTVLSVAVREVEPERFVFSVRYQEPVTICDPPPRRYYAVSRIESQTVTELDARDWPVFGIK